MVDQGLTPQLDFTINLIIKIYETSRLFLKVTRQSLKATKIPNTIIKKYPIGCLIFFVWRGGCDKKGPFPP
jgi:hypothetical protein